MSLFDDMPDPLKPIACNPERRALLLWLAQKDGQPWTEDQGSSGWTDHMAEIMYGDDADRWSDAEFDHRQEWKP